MLVLGYGCNAVSAKQTDNCKKSMHRALTDHLGRTTVDEIVLFCNQSKLSTVYDIATTYCSIKPSLSNHFVKEVFDHVVEHLKQGHIVSLAGHSYGGSVVARVTELLAKKQSTSLGRVLNQFRAATFGSIYVPESSTVDGINVAHYMYVNDVALKCNGLARPDARVKWLRTPNYQSPLQKQFAFLGNEDEWIAHNSYTDYILKFAISMQRGNWIEPAKTPAKTQKKTKTVSVNRQSQPA